MDTKYFVYSAYNQQKVYAVGTEKEAGQYLEFLNADRDVNLYSYDAALPGSPEWEEMEARSDVCDLSEEIDWDICINGNEESYDGHYGSMDADDFSEIFVPWIDRLSDRLEDAGFRVEINSSFANWHGGRHDQLRDRQGLIYSLDRQHDTRLVPLADEIASAMLSELQEEIDKKATTGTD